MKKKHSEHKGGGNRGETINGTPAGALIDRFALDSPLKPQELAPTIELAIQANHLTVPARETIIKRIRAARSSMGHLDDPWSLGSFSRPVVGPGIVNHPIPVEAILDLLDVWKDCLAMDHVFTIREAQWVTRIRFAFPNIPYKRKRNGFLFGFAYEYALRERVAGISGIAMDTRDLDAALRQDWDKGGNGYEWDDVVFRALGLFPRLTKDCTSHEPGRFNQFDIFVSPSSHVVDHKMPLKSRSFWNETRGFTGLWNQLTESQDRSFAALLTYLSKGPNWNTLMGDDYVAVLEYLHDLVTKELVSQMETETQAYLDSHHFENLDFSNWGDRPNGLSPEDVLSPGILEAVGYEVSTHSEMIDTQISQYSGKARFKAVFKGTKNRTQEGGTA